MKLTTEVTKSEELQSLVTEYNELKEAKEGAAQRVRELKEELETALAAAKQELKTAVDAALLDPSRPNTTAERKAREKVAEIETEIELNADRKAQVNMLNGEELSATRRKVLSTGMSEAGKAYNDQFDARVERILAAKQAYLNELRELHELKENAVQMYRNTAQEAQIIVDQMPHFKTLYPYNVNQLPADRPGITEQEINDAIQHGK